MLEQLGHIPLAVLILSFPAAYFFTPVELQALAPALAFVLGLLGSATAIAATAGLVYDKMLQPVLSWLDATARLLLSRRYALVCRG